jgi:hypothetical protein
MIEPTDEMADAFRRAAWAKPVWIAGQEVPNLREGITAVLAIVERDYPIGPIMCDASCPTEDLAYCELPRGHKGTHSATVEKAVDW